MSQFTFPLLSLLSLACTGAPTDDSGEDDADSPDILDTVPAGDPPPFSALEEALEGYHAWPQTDFWTGVQEGAGIHGPWVQIWWNQVAFDTIQGQGGGDMPVGAIAVKDAYRNPGDTEVTAYVAMWKTEDYGWFFARWTPDGTVTHEGKPEFCMGCHSAGQDWVLGEPW